METICWKLPYVRTYNQLPPYLWYLPHNERRRRVVVVVVKANIQKKMRNLSVIVDGKLRTST